MPRLLKYEIYWIKRSFGIRSMANPLTFIRNKEIMHANQPINLRVLLHAQPNKSLCGGSASLRTA
jgi:hypothetical protein